MPCDKGYALMQKNRFDTTFTSTIHLVSHFIFVLNIQY